MLHFRVYYISKRETKRDFYVPFFAPVRGWKLLLKQPAPRGRQERFLPD